LERRHDQTLTKNTDHVKLQVPGKLGELFIAQLMQ
jgi:hypothetical protein